MAGELLPVPEGESADKFPEQSAAGKLLPEGNTAASCLTEVFPRPITPTTVRKFRNTTNPAPGVRRIFYGRADDPDVASELTHGIVSDSSLSAASLINPLPKTRFQQKIQDRNEAIYFSNRQGTLGRSHDQSSMLPEGLDIINTTFGTKIIKGQMKDIALTCESFLHRVEQITCVDHVALLQQLDISAGELINPPKTFEEVNKEAREGHDLYIVSHNDYYVGEAINRKYDSPNFSKSFVYGKATPHFKDGRGVSKSLNWFCDLQLKKAAKIVSQESGDFKETCQPQLEGVLDPIAEAVNNPQDHTFGAVLHTDKVGVGDLLHYHVPRAFLHGKDKEKVVLTAVRQSLKKANFENFDMLLAAFRHYDKNGDGMIDKNDLQKSCFQLNVNLDDELLNSLFDCCDVDKNGLINYMEFTNFLNWKDKKALKDFEEKVITRGKRTDAPVLPEDTKIHDELLLKQEDRVLKELESSEKALKMLPRSTHHILPSYQTTSSQYNAVVGGLPTTCYPVCGVPNIRSDIPVPRIRHVSDRTNYGDQDSAYALLFPSVFSQRGVNERDFFKTRSKAEIAQLLRNTDMNISDERFEEIWKQACVKHQKDEVCLERIKNILHEICGSYTKPSC